MTQSQKYKELKAQASLKEFLSRLGFEPARKYGKELMYRSMLRDGDNNPSFSVDDNLGTWYDHGNGNGGNIIDLGLALWPSLTFNEVIEKIQTACNIASGQPSVRPRITAKVRNYVIEQVKALGTHSAITTYLQGRGIFESARSRMNEIYYHVKDADGAKKQFFAAGWKNEAGSWEVRNKYFKGCLGEKAITFISVDPKKVTVFEGFINYLSWLKDNPRDASSVIVLNTLSLLKAGVDRARQFTFIDLYLDRDPAGFQATKDFIKALPYADDRSGVYENYNDYNDLLVASIRKQTEADTLERKPRGLKL